MSKRKMRVKDLKALLEGQDDNLLVTLRINDVHGYYDAHATMAGEDTGETEMFEFFIEGMTKEAEQDAEDEG